MIQHEHTFTRKIAIDDFFNLMVKNTGRHAGWKFELDAGLYTIVWTPSILLNAWQMHPKVTATLEEVSEGTTRCRVTTVNKGFFDPFGIFKRVHLKTYNKLLGPLRELTKDHESASNGK